MFTGLVETIGVVERATGHSPRRLCIRSNIPVAEVDIGASVAVDGCCLTVVEKSGQTLELEAATETLSRTTLGGLRAGSRVHLERAMRLGDRLDGHLVSGHVDGLGVLRAREQRQSALYLGVQVPAEVARVTVPRGSITLAGVSLTVTEVQQDTLFVGLVPHTVAVTTLAELDRGASLNVEADIIGRYVEKMLSSRDHVQPRGLTAQWLKDRGFA